MKQKNINFISKRKIYKHSFSNNDSNHKIVSMIPCDSQKLPNVYFEDPTIYKNPKSKKLIEEDKQKGAKQ